jgi:release factor glutamine methyltransferase
MDVLVATSDTPLDADIHDRLEQMLSRRLLREPLWHIVGTAPFMGLELEVGPGVFIPRPETELLAHTAITELLAMVPADGELRLCDVGAGSGAIGLAIVQAVTHASVTSVEPSEAARGFLRSNISSWGDGRVSLLELTAEQARSEVVPESLDMVVSNPPYIDRGSEWVDHETRHFDPPEAVFAEDSGLQVMADVVRFAQHALRHGGVLLVEHGINHNERLATMLSDHGFGHISHHNDMTGRPRFTRASKT